MARSLSQIWSDELIWCTDQVHNTFIMHYGAANNLPKIGEKSVGQTHGTVLLRSGD